MKYKGFNIMKKRFLAALLCLCLLVGLVPGMGTTAWSGTCAARGMIWKP